MKRRLDYHTLLQNWMSFFTLTTKASKRIFSSIWMRLQTNTVKRAQADADGRMLSAKRQD